MTTHVRNHGQVESGRHPGLVQAALLGADEGGHVLRPEGGRAQDAGLLLAVRLGHLHLQADASPRQRPTGLHT